MLQKLTARGGRKDNGPDRRRKLECLRANEIGGSCLPVASYSSCVALLVVDERKAVRLLVAGVFRCNRAAEPCLH